MWWPPHFSQLLQEFKTGAFLYLTFICMLSLFDKLDLQPPKGLPPNIIGVKRIDKKVYRFCTCGKKIRDINKVKPENHKCKNLKVETLEEKLDKKIAQRLQLKVPKSKSYNETVSELIGQIKTSMRQLLEQNLKHMLFYQFGQTSLTPQVCLKVHRHVFNEMTNALLDLKSKIFNEHGLTIEKIKNQQKYNVPIEKIIFKAEDLFKKQIILERLEQLELKQISKDAYRKEINNLCKKFNSPVHLDLSLDNKRILPKQMIRFRDLGFILGELIAYGYQQTALDLYLMFISGCRKNDMNDLQSQTLQVLKSQTNYYSNIVQRKNAKVGFIYYPQQFIMLAKKYEWSGFSSFFPKILEKLKEIFCFPFYTLKRLYLICISVLYKKELNLNLARFSIGHSNQQVTSLYTDPMMHKIRLENRQKLEFEQLQFFSDLNRNQSEYEILNSFPFIYEVGTSFISKLRQSIPVVTLEDVQIPIQNNISQDSRKSTIKKVKKIKKQNQLRTIRQKHNLSKQEEIFIEQQSFSMNYIRIFQQNQSQFNQLIQKSFLKIPMEQKQKQQHHQINQPKNLDLEAQDLNKSHLPFQKSLQSKQQSGKISYIHEANLHFELFDNSKDKKQLLTSRNFIPQFSQVKMVDEKDEQKLPLLSLLSKQDAHNEKLDQRENCLIQRNDSDNRQIHHQEQMKSDQNEKINSENNCQIKISKQFKLQEFSTVIGRLQQFKFKGKMKRTLQGYALLDKPVQTILKKLYSIKVNSLYFEMLLKKCLNCKQEIGKNLHSELLICTICTAMFHTTCNEKKVTFPDEDCINCTRKRPNQSMRNKKSLKILPTYFVDKLQASKLKLYIPSKFYDNSQNKSNYLEIEKTMQYRGKKLVKNNELWVSKIKYEFKYDPFIEIANESIQNAYKKYMQQKYYPPVKIKLIKQNNYSIFAAAKIPSLMLICEYAGNILQGSFSNIQLVYNMTYMWRNSYHSQLIISPVFQGSIGTLMNHRPKNISNISITRVFVQGQVRFYLQKIKILMYSNRSIQQNEQLVYDYCDRQQSTYDVVNFELQL